MPRASKSGCPRRTLAGLLLAGLWLPGLPLGAAPQAPPALQEHKTSSSVQELKTAFIYQFARLTTWPAKSFKSKDDPLVIAILGSNPLGKHILKLAGKHIGKRTVKVLLIKKLKEALQAQVVFVAWKRDDQQKKTLLVLKQHHILTVGDSTLFAKEGGALHLALVRRKVRFDINLKALKAAGLTVHPKLIKLARRVF